MVKVFFLLIATVFLFADDTGKTSRNYAVSNFTTAIANPITSNKSFVTMDGKKNFKGNLTCNGNTKSFLDISYSGASDINVTVNFDKDLNGSKEAVYTFSNISGVGANGVIMCTPNSWNNCNYYTFSYNGSTLSLIPKTRNDIGGAYCINSSCGNIATTRKADVLNTLGSAISSVISAYHTSYLITKTSNNGNIIEYYGQNYQDCSNLTNYGTNNIAYDERNGDTLLKNKTNSSLSSNVVYNNVLDSSNRYNASSTELKGGGFTSYKQTKKELSNTLTLNNDSTFTYTTSQGSGTGKLTGVNFTSAQFCQITKPITDATLYSDGTNKSNTTSSTTTYKDFIIECVGDSFNVCPVVSSAGELIKYDCGQINNFGEVTSALSVVQEATNDFTCSTK